MINLASAIPYTGIFFLFFLAAVALINAILNHKYHHLWLTVFLAALAFYQLTLQIYGFGSPPYWQFSGRLTTPAILAIFPAFYMFVRTLVTNRAIHFNLWFWHFLPAGGLLIMALSPLPRWMMGENTPISPLLFPYARFIVVLQIGIYFGSFLYRFSYLSRYFQQYASSTTPSNRHRIRNLLVAFTILMLLLDTWLMGLIINIEKYQPMYAIVVMAAAVLVALFAMKAECLQPQTLIAPAPLEIITIEETPADVPQQIQESDTLIITIEPQPEQPLPTGSETNGTAEPSKQAFGPAQQQALYQKLRHFLVEEKAYTNADLSLKITATTLGTNTRYLSLVINQFEGNNFQQMLNKYRIDHVIKLMNDNTKNTYTLYGLAQIAGFSSKSTFISAFRSQTGHAPAEFQKKINDETPKLGV